MVSPQYIEGSDKRAKQALFNSMEVYYNQQRKHSTNIDNPAQYEMEWWNNRKEA
jgi:hypothetical protein